MTSFGVEAEKYLKGLLMWQANEGSQGGPANLNRNQGILVDGRGTQRGTGRCSWVGPFKCYNCQQFGHMAHNGQNPMMPHSGWQQFTSIPTQGFNIHMCTFVPVQYQTTVPLVSQPVMLGPMLSFNHASGPLRTPMLVNVRLAGNGMAQGSVAAFAAGQEILD